MFTIYHRLEDLLLACTASMGHRLRDRAVVNGLRYWMARDWLPSGMSSCIYGNVLQTKSLKPTNKNNNRSIRSAHWATTRTRPDTLKIVQTSKFKTDLFVCALKYVVNDGAMKRNGKWRVSKHITHQMAANLLTRASPYRYEKKKFNFKRKRES